MSFSESDERWDDDFYRWYVGGSPPESDAWPRHAFEHALAEAQAGLTATGRLVTVRVEVDDELSGGTQSR